MATIDGSLELKPATTVGRLQDFAGFIVNLQLKTFDAAAAQLVAINTALDACQAALKAATTNQQSGR